MFTGIAQSIIILVFVGIFYGMDTAYIHKFDAVRQAEGSGRSVSYTLFVASLVAVLVLQPVFLPQVSLIVSGDWGIFIQGLGVVTILIAMGLHLWSRRHLRQFYAERVELQREHQLIDSGPYATVRHPVFTSFFLFAGGLLLINPALPSALVFAYTLWDFSRAARAEETLLCASLPGYTEYMDRTGAFFPRRISLRAGNQHEH
jgi:protein-S-isoprenylcysteine O-methyltransferase Ste14